MSPGKPLVQRPHCWLNGWKSLSNAAGLTAPAAMLWKAKS